MPESVIVLPNQLFKDHPAFDACRRAVLVEHPRFFSQQNFHKKKLVLHRATMQAFADQLRARNFEVSYIEHAEFDGVDRLLRRAGSTVHLADPIDRALQSELDEAARSADIDLKWHSTPMFLSPPDWLREQLREGHRHKMTSFYIAQRKRLDVLVSNGKPEGGKWSYDPKNRRRLPKDLEVPAPDFPDTRRYRQYVGAAAEYVDDAFPNNPGETDGFFYPVRHADADDWLDDFLGNRLKLFGDYEDAIARDETFLFHSVLTPMLNTGLLTPRQVVDRTLQHARHHEVPLNSLEGFVRQIVGWREFMRAIYLLEYEREVETDFWGHHRPMPKSFYTAETGVKPVDVTIHKLMDTAYLHHIERLMILGNFMLLCEIAADEVYRWFMELFIDAYDWVMVPNVYGMSQYADGGLITTKPYISSSNYVRKMSDYGSGDWCEIWDGLYWRFIDRHRKVFEETPRMNVMTSMLDRMDAEKRRRYFERADGYLARLHGNRD